MAERVLTGHAEIFGLLSFMSTLWARRSLAFLLLEHFASSVIVTETCLKNSSSLTVCPNNIHNQTRLMKILTLHRRQECWPRRLQDKPEIGAKVIKVESLIVKNFIKTRAVRQTYIYKSPIPGSDSSPGVRTDHPHTRSCGKKSSGKCVHLYIIQQTGFDWYLQPWQSTADLQ